MPRKSISDRIANQKLKQIFAIIRKQGLVSKQELLEQSGIHSSTLTRILEELTEQGLIVEAGFGESTGGRKPILYRVNAAYASIFGLDISRTYSKLILFDMHLNKLDSKRWSMTETMTPAELILQVSQTANQMLETHGIRRETVLGMGIGAVGPLDRSAGRILNPLLFPAKGWRNVDICQQLENELDLPVLLDNGANAAILGEYWADLPHEYQHLLYVHAGVGLRSAVMTGGKVVYGAFDMEGAVGQMVIQTDKLPDHASGRRYGCLESYATLFAVEQAAQNRVKQGRPSILCQLERNPDQISYSHMLQALRQNDPLAAEIICEAGTYFGIGLGNLLNMLHPEKVILGGPLVTGNELFFDSAIQVALKNTYYYPHYQVIFSKGNLGKDAVPTGAAVMLMNQLTE